MQFLLLRRQTAATLPAPLRLCSQSQNSLKGFNSVFKILDFRWAGTETKRASHRTCPRFGNLSIRGLQLLPVVAVVVVVVVVVVAVVVVVVVVVAIVVVVVVVVVALVVVVVVIIIIIIIVVIAIIFIVKIIIVMIIIIISSSLRF